MPMAVACSSQCGVSRLALQMYQCPYCKYSNTDVNRLRVHAMTQHSVQPMLRCPLCQDMLNNKIHLQLHLTHLHSVSPDCVEKLIMTVSVWVSEGSRCLPGGARRIQHCQMPRTSAVTRGSRQRPAPARAVAACLFPPRAVLAVETSAPRWALRGSAPSGNWIKGEISSSETPGQLFNKTPP